MPMKWSEALTTETSALVEKFTVSNRERIRRAIDAGGFHGALLATRLTARQAREASRKTAIELLVEKLDFLGQPALSDVDLAALHGLDVAVASELCSTLFLECAPVETADISAVLERLLSHSRTGHTATILEAS